MKLKHLIFVDDEPLVIEMMMNLLSAVAKQKISFKVYSDPDMVADLIEEEDKLSNDHIIVIDRFLFQRDTLDMRLPDLYRSLGFKGPILIFSYVTIAYDEHGYDDYLKKDLNSVEAFIKWLKA